MRFKTALLFLFLIACSDTLLYRANVNYFPLPYGAQWQYLRSGTDTVSLQVDTAPAILLNQSCVRVYRDYAPEYYTVTPFEIRRLFVNTRSVPGSTEETLEFRFGLVYQLPLVSGNIYQDSFFDTIITPDTLIPDTAYSHIIGAEVVGVDSVTTPAGKFYDCYRIKFNEVKVLGAETTRVAWEEWLAPETGVVKRKGEDFEELLVRYQPRP